MRLNRLLAPKIVPLWHASNESQAIALRLRLYLTVLLAIVSVALPPLVWAQSTPSNAPQTLLIVGDSLSSEYGIGRQTGWVHLLRNKLAQDKIPVQVINASISGDTTSGGLTRLPALLSEHRPQIVLIELGGNDALRGLSLAMTTENLTKMVQLSQAQGAKVILAGMQIPPNYGIQYTTEFKALYPKVAQQTQSALIPFLLAGLEDRPDLFISDNIHPNEAAQPIILNNVWPILMKQLVR